MLGEGQLIDLVRQHCSVGEGSKQVSEPRGSEVIWRVLQFCVDRRVIAWVHTLTAGTDGEPWRGALRSRANYNESQI